MCKPVLFLCLAVALLTFSSATLCAQLEVAPEAPAVPTEESPEQGGRGFGGRGRFGEQAMGFVPLLQIDSVKQELKLEGDQATQVDSLTIKIREDFAGEIRELMQSLRDADPAERQQFRERMAEIVNRVNERLGTVLNSEQSSRLRQINLQLGLRRDGAAVDEEPGARPE